MNSTADQQFRRDLVDKLPNLRRFGLVLCRNAVQADDLVQATCERALAKSSQFQVGTKFDSWLFAIMHSIWKNQLRKAATADRADIKLKASQSAVDGENIATQKIFFSEVLSKLEQLPIEQAMALTLVSIEGMAYRDAAESLGIPIGTLESRIARARVSLGRVIVGESNEPQQEVRRGER